MSILTIFIWIIGIFSIFIGVKYNHSRNKKIFFKDGPYRTFIVSFVIILFGSLILYLYMPEDPIDLAYLKFHSEALLEKLDGATGIQKYVLFSISIFSEIHLIGLLGALMVTLIWMYYIRRLDFFNTEKMGITILVFVLAVLLTFFTIPLSDLIKGVFSISYSSDRFYNLFVYSTLGIGVVEEFIKFIPVLVVYFATNEIDEPIDFIYYACMSALGFAFLENLLYFRDISDSIILGRALTAAVGHMVDSTIVVYGLLLYKYKPGRRKLSIIVYYFLLGAFVHGLYDFLLFENLIFFFFVFFVLIIQIWAVMINNAINNSKFFDYSIHYKHDLVKFRLSVFFSLLILLNFTLNIMMEGKDVAILRYPFTLIWTGVLLIFYMGTISSFDLFKGYWRPLQFNLRRPGNKSLPGARGASIWRSLFTENTIVPINHVGKNIKLHCPTNNEELSKVFFMSDGGIEGRTGLVSENEFEPDWFVVNLMTPLNSNDEYEKERILIRFKSKYASLVHDEHIDCWLRLIPKGINPYAEKCSDKYPSAGNIAINGEDYEY